MANALEITLRAISAASAPGAGASVNINDGVTDARANRTSARLLLEVTAISGVGASLTVTVETSPDGTSGWRTVDAFPAATAPVEVMRAFAQLDKYVRVSWTLAGTLPSATFMVDGQAHQLFLDKADISMSELRDKALVNVPAYVMADACIIASGKIESALVAFTPPILSIGEQLRQSGVVIAAYQVLKWRGFSPDGPDQLLVDDKNAAEKYLRDVATGKIDPDVVDSSTTDGPTMGLFAIASDPRRGW